MIKFLPKGSLNFRGVEYNEGNKILNDNENNVASLLNLKKMHQREAS
jgi:hypothetical protein